jgi:hypothetical protein
MHQSQRGKIKRSLTPKTTAAAPFNGAAAVLYI